ncbi:MAG TPA: hypothetical protein VJV03_05740 [Pyrinomonadaceae bacterium]|nr:hypothetical protein [Pyrinomonadaceae bacterium]
MVISRLYLLSVLLLIMATGACQQVSISQDARARSNEQKQKQKRQPQKQKAPAPSSDVYGPPVKLGDLEDKAISESSGLVASRTSPGNYWTHNDSGNGPVIYAFDSQGRRRGVWRVTGAISDDWEDMAPGPGPKPNVSYLYIGDIGDNDGTRSEIHLWRIPEPVVPAVDTGSTEAKPAVTEAAEKIRLRYPDGKHDSEALLIHPTTGRIYVVTKVPLVNATVYAADMPSDTREVVTLTRVGEVEIPGLAGGIITGGDISPDGLRLALCDYFNGYEFVLKDPGSPFDSIWNGPPTVVDIGNRKHGETISYRLDGKALMSTSERLPTPLFETIRK